MSRRSVPALLLSGAISLTLALGVAPTLPTASAAPSPAQAGASATTSSAVQPLAAAGDRRKKKKKKKAKKRKKTPAAATSQGGTLTYGPRTFVGGQALTFSGRLKVSGKRAISLQQHMGRPGDTWFAVPGFRGTTNSDGSFRFAVPGPDMMNIKFRVVAAGTVTPPVLMVSKAQGIDMWVEGQSRATGSRTPFTVDAGRAFTVVADTSPDIPGRSTVRGTPVFPGRIVTLQRRVSPTVWSNVARAPAGANGLAHFRDLVETSSRVVYRVRQEAIKTGANRIGWTPSFPTHIAVRNGSGARAAGTAASEAWSQGRAVAASASSARSGGASRTAASTHGWGAMLFDFAWELGESIEDAPKRGTGSFAEYSDGSGRVSKHNGQIVLDSKREDMRGTGDFGTTMATMQGNARAYGRWEQRLRLRTAENGAPGGDYAVRLELVPANSSQYASGTRNILIGEVRAHSNVMTFGAKNGALGWTGRRAVAGLVTGSPAIAVEVLPGHVTWFVDGTPVGTVNHASVTSGVPLTLRMSLVANGTQEMNQVTVFSDWQRGYAHTTGRAVNGPAVPRTS